MNSKREPVVPECQPLTEPRFPNLVRFVEEDRGHSSPCHIWQGAKISSGYGHLSMPGVSPQKMILAHRASYIEANGSIPEGLTIDHLCRVPLCINADHLEAVSQAENTRRAMALKTHCPRGHEYTPENMMKGARKCRTCDNESGLARYYRRKGARV